MNANHLTENFVSYPNICVVYQPANLLIKVSEFIKTTSGFASLLLLHLAQNLLTFMYLLFIPVKALSITQDIWVFNLSWGMEVYNVEKSYVTKFFAFVSHCFKSLWTLRVIDYPKQIVSCVIFYPLTINLMSLLDKL